MNTKTLQKAIDELKKETPNISYVLGMLETIIELSGAPVPYNTPSLSSYSGTPTILKNDNIIQKEEGSDLLAAYERGGPIGNLG